MFIFWIERYSESSSWGGDGPEIDNVGKLERRAVGVILGCSAKTGEVWSFSWHSTSNSIVSGNAVVLSSVSHSRFSENRR